MKTETNFIKGIQIVNPIMDFLFDDKTPRKTCSACREENSSIHVQPKEPIRLNVPSIFGLKGFETASFPDGASFGLEGKEIYTVFVYQCLKCNHLDFYGLPLKSDLKP